MKTNGFLGKVHSEEAKEKMRKIDKSYMQKPEYKENMSKTIKEYRKNHPEYIEKIKQSRLKVDYKGNKNPAWRGGLVNMRGYVLEYCPHHPFNSQGYVFQHRLIMEKYIKRFLLPEERVHHINGIKDDNRIENLQLLDNIGEHNKIHNEINPQRKKFFGKGRKVV